MAVPHFFLGNWEAAEAANLTEAQIVRCDSMDVMGHGMDPSESCFAHVLEFLFDMHE